MSTALAPRTDTPLKGELLERALIGGDLAGLTPAERLAYYQRVCESLGLNPLTKPFSYIVLNGKLVLYALRDATEQLRKLHGLSIAISAREVVEDCYVVTALARTPDGRTDESIGAVPIAGLKGEFRANAMMKAETKAKRRVTLSICGLGMLDETEVESIPDTTAPAPETTVTVKGKLVQTAGVTRATLTTIGDLVKQLDAAAGGGTAKALLPDGITSTLFLSEDAGLLYASVLREALASHPAEGGT